MNPQHLRGLFALFQVPSLPLKDIEGLLNLG
jgi:hypothetical protein